MNRPPADPLVRLAGVRLALVDIEGTVSPTAVVVGTLFDDARRHLDSWVTAHATDPEIAGALDDVASDAGLAPDATLDARLAVLRQWIDDDVKAPPLKTIQGRIWAAGFAEGRLRAEFFADSIPALTAWADAGVALAVYSSGSVTVQRPWFAELDDRVGAYFDTANAGPKREASSYAAIVDAVERQWGFAAGEIAFFSDVPAELDAAATAGIVTVGVARPGEPYGDADFGPHAVVASLDQVPLDEVTRFDAPAAAPAGRTTIDAERVRTAGRQLADEAHRLAAHGWLRATAGNLSTVLERRPLRLAVTASAVDKGELTEHDVVVVDETGAPVAVDGLEPRRPSAEAELHAHIAARTGAGAVVHVHALSPVVAAERFPDGVPIDQVEMVKAFGHDADGTATIPVIANSQRMDVLAERLDAVLDRLGSDPVVPAVIVARHGMYVWGDDLRQARHRAEGIEWAISFINETGDRTR